MRDCRGFGRTIGIDYGLVVPDEAKTLARRRDQAVADARATRSARTTCMRYAKQRGIPSTCRGASSRASSARGCIDGEGCVAAAQVVRRRALLRWLETKAYKMHVRVLLSKYRCYTRARPAPARA